MQRVIAITTAMVTSAEVDAIKRRIAECLAL
jgi:hypothetical protein